MFPDWRNVNPYLDLLAAAVEARGWEVTFPPAPAGHAAPLHRALRLTGGADVVHLHWQHEYTLPAGAGLETEAPVALTALKSVRFLAEVAALRARGIPVVWTVHNPVSHERHAERTERTASAALARLASALVVLGESARPVVAEAYRLSPERAVRIEVVRHGPLLGVYGPLPDRKEARRALGLEEEAFVYLHLGALRAYKRAGRVARAFRAVEDRAARLVVAGQVVEPAVGEALKAAARADPRIRLDLRHVPAGEVAALLAAADALVYAGHTVLLSGVVVLALGAGLPMVLPRSGVLADYVPEGGAAWYDPAEPGALERAMAEIRGRDLEAMRRANRAAGEALSWEEAAERLTALYGRLAGGPKR